MNCRGKFGLISLLLSLVVCEAATGSRFTYLTEENAYHVNGDFPKLTTPMWVGEPGVDAAVLLSIDDMCRPFPDGRPQGLPVYARQPRVYFDFLKPIIDRLRKIDGRAPISVFCLQLDPDDKLVQEMLQLGLSMECHTFTHPVPLMRAAQTGDSLALARNDYIRSVENLHRVHNSSPVAHRTPGCDARNTASPRFFTELFPLKTAGGNFLRMDSSIFLAFTTPDPTLPREWFVHPDGRPRFTKFINGIPYTKTFVNYVENYPYPYVINNQLWELPAVIPGDAHGVHAYKHRSPKTVEDWKRAIDIIVAKKGLFTLCFHPHGYIDAKQIVGLIDYITQTYGKRVKFLNCREINERLTRNAGGGHALRADDGSDNGVRMLDVNADGSLDTVIANGSTRTTRVWSPLENRYRESSFPLNDLRKDVQFLTADAKGNAAVASLGTNDSMWRFEEGAWIRSTTRTKLSKTLQFRDLNGDGLDDLIHSDSVILAKSHLHWPSQTIPLPLRIGPDVRFVDIDRDGDVDLIQSNEKGHAIWLFESDKGSWKRLLAGAGGMKATVPPIAIQSRNAGSWFARGAMHLVNEFTRPEPDHVIVRRFEDWIQSGK
jgi:hypothetical protein